MIRDAKAEGLKITVETCPHYLFFSSEEISDFYDNDTRFKCTPPIREKANREKLWDAVKAGVIDFIVSDHSPCSPELKCRDEGNFENAWGGISSLQLGLSVIWTEARKRGLTLQDVSKLMSLNTASFIGLENKKGKLKKGFDADLIIFNPDTKFIADENNLYHKHKITPDSGREFFGVVEATYLGGIKFSGMEKSFPNRRENNIEKPAGINKIKKFMERNATAEFAGLIDLASEKNGGKTLIASDEFFAPKENLLKEGRGIFIPDKYTDRREVDGWMESRRKRVPGFDWCILKLGVPGIIQGIDIDTNHFLGNHPPYASVEACYIEEEADTEEFLSGKIQWIEILQ